MKWRDRPSFNDPAAVKRIVASTGVFNEEEVKVAVELVDDRLKNGISSDYHFIFAEHEGEVLAYTCFGRIPFTDGRFDLYWIAVAPEAQKKNLAAQLLAITEGAVKKLGGKKLYAETSSRTVYAPAHKFYERHGFARESTLKDFYKDGDDKLTFSKDL